MAYKNKCTVCGVTERCKRAFGQYWSDKSHGGEGCNYIFPKCAASPHDKPAPDVTPKKAPRKFNLPRQEEFA